MQYITRAGRRWPCCWRWPGPAQRRRMRLIDDTHGHAWPDDGEPRPVAAP